MKHLFFSLLAVFFSLATLAQPAEEQHYCGLCGHPLDLPVASAAEWGGAHKAAPADWEPPFTIDFFAAFDPDGAEWALDKCGTLEAYGQHVVESMNNVMYNSNLPAKFRLVGTRTVAKNITDVPHGMAACLNDRELIAAVEAVRGDVTLLFAGMKGSYSSISGNAPYMPNPGHAYGCVTVKSGYETMTAIHEVGHMMGCGHSRDVDRGETHEYAVGAMRYDDQGNQYSTVMGYHGTLIPYFSSPNLYYKGLQMGSATEDNQRRILERLPEIVRLGDPRNAYVLDTSEWEADYLVDKKTVQIIEAPKAYFIETDAEWLSTDPKMGWLTGPFVIQTKLNDTGLARVGHVTLVDADKDNPDYTRNDICDDYVITVVQRAEGGLVVVESVVADEDEGSPSFDLQGRRVQKPRAKGLYIAGGRKHIEK